MEVWTSVAGLRTALRAARRGDCAITLVPTMGYLHEGHAALIRKAAESAGRVVVSIFVNPLQFGPGEDYDRYPRDLERDKRIAAAAGATDLFVPSAGEMTPTGLAVTVDPGRLGDGLCGLSRPGHFRGVCTIVAKLFHVVEPDTAVFGWKDAQQLVILRKMVADLDMPVDLVGVETVREPDGLAMSSRNVNLTPEERRAAPAIYEALREGMRLAETEPGLCSQEITECVRRRFDAIPGAVVDYVELVSVDDLGPLDHPRAGHSLLAVAVRFSGARLIDNVRF